MEGFERADRRQNDRQTELSAQEFDRTIDLRDIVQDAWAQAPGIQRVAIAPQGRLGFRSTDQIIPKVAG